MNTYKEHRKLLLQILGNKCAKCGDVRAFIDGKSNFEIDHIHAQWKYRHPYERINSGHMYWFTIKHLLAELENLQILCALCHKQKTANEKTERANFIKANCHVLLPAKIDWCNEKGVLGDVCVTCTYQYNSEDGTKCSCCEYFYDKTRELPIRSHMERLIEIMLPNGKTVPPCD